MRRIWSLAAVLLCVGAALVLSGCGAKPVSISNVEKTPVVHQFFHAILPGGTPGCASDDCGPYSATLNWSPIQWGHTTTGYNILLNGSQYTTKTSSPYTFLGMDCGTTFTLGAQAFDSTGDTSNVVSLSYTTPDCPSDSPFPLQVSGNGRFLEDASGDPWLMVGDSPQAAVGNLSEANWETFVDERASEGFNTLWVNAPCSAYTACDASGEAYDESTGDIDIKPFTSGTSPANYAIADPNSTYFAKAHTMAAYAETQGVEILLDPIDTSNCSTGFWQTLTNGGNGAASTSNPTYAYGQFIGSTFADTPNVSFFLGNDDSCFDSDQDADNDLYELAQGIRNTDPDALQTLEIGIGGFDNEGWASLDDTSNTWDDSLDVNGFYSYAPDYAIARHAYGQTSTQPTALLESNYEFQKNGDTDGCGSNEGDSTDRNCRLEEWWAMTSGATGQLYGDDGVYQISNSTNLSTIDTLGVSQLVAQATFFRTIDWSSLAPDANGSGHLVTSGGGTCPTTGSIVAVTCVTAAINSAGTLALIYMPNPSSLGTVTVDLTKLTGTVTAKWVDPADGAETTATHGGTTSAATFTPTGANSVGDDDWALLLQSS